MDTFVLTIIAVSLLSIAYKISIIADALMEQNRILESKPSIDKYDLALIMKQNSRLEDKDSSKDESNKGWAS